MFSAARDFGGVRFQPGRLFSDTSKALRDCFFAGMKKCIEP